MSPTLILWPGIAMAALTFAVLLRLVFVRLGELKRFRIHPQSISTSALAAAKYQDVRAADNFRNLFELPVLFYAALGVAFATGQVSVTTLALAWTFVALRIAHSAIHCGYNRVKHRFAAFALSTLALLLLWVVLAIGLMQ